MSNELEMLRDALLALPATQVERPRMPIATYFQEAHDMLAFASTPEVRAALSAVGLAPDLLDRAAVALEAGRQAQSGWAVVRSARTPEALTQAREEAAAVRSDHVAALRWNLRGDRMVQAALDAIMEGDGDADLVQDLVDTSALITAHASAFDTDTTFDAAAQVQRGRDASAVLRSLVTDVVLATEDKDALDLRDRAYTHLDGLLSEIRIAGRYALRHDADAVRRFGSAYLRRRNAAQRRARTPEDADQ